MPLPAEVLSQLLHGFALSGQPEAQRGLSIIFKGTGGNWPQAAKLFATVSDGEDVVYLDKASGTVCQV